MRTRTPTGRRAAAGALLLSVGALGCARALPPPGGERDTTPPEVVAIRPAPESTVAPNDRAVVIEFDERISEQNLENAVVVSPVTGAVRVEKGQRELEVRLAGGWQPGYVYRVSVRPVVRDLFNNTIPRPIEFAFSTGPDFPDPALAGVVYDRITQAAVPDARVEARPAAGGAYHLALTDTAGIYAMPLVPAGEYLVRAYLDQNRDRLRQSFEPGDSVRVTLGAADTLLRPLALMRPDSTAARLTVAEPLGPTAIELLFDDYMDPARPQENARVQVWRLPDSTAVPLAGVFYPAVYQARLAEEEDSLAAAADTAAVPPDTLAAADTTAAGPPPGRRAVPAAPPVDEAADTAIADTLPRDPLRERVRAAGLRPVGDSLLPTRELVVRLDEPLEPGVTYRVSVTGIVNISGLTDGAGTATFEGPQPEPEPEPEPEMEPPAEVQREPEVPRVQEPQERESPQVPQDAQAEEQDAEPDPAPPPDSLPPRER